MERPPLRACGGVHCYMPVVVEVVVVMVAVAAIGWVGDDGRSVQLGTAGNHTLTYSVLPGSTMQQYQ